LKKKISSASVYLAAALAMGAYYDAVYGAGPVTRHTVLLSLGVSGAFLFGFTSLLSFWKPHRAVLVGILACCLCWSDFARIVPQIPFLQVFSIIGYATLTDLRPDRPTVVEGFPKIPKNCLGKGIDILTGRAVLAASIKFRLCPVLCLPAVPRSCDGLRPHYPESLVPCGVRSYP
jgi:hypothetical protein